MHTSKEIFHRLISPLYFHLQVSDKAYKKYKENSVFVHAQALRRSNQRIAKLIINNTGLIPNELYDHLQELINHYDIWFTQFRLYQKKIKPGPGDTFVFEQADHQCAFPGHAQKRVYDYFEHLQNELKEESIPVDIQQ